jgi:hypothetical protein
MIRTMFCKDESDHDDGDGDDDDEGDSDGDGSGNGHGDGDSDRDGDGNDGNPHDEVTLESDNNPQPLCKQRTQVAPAAGAAHRS